MRHNLQGQFSPYQFLTQSAKRGNCTHTRQFAADRSAPQTLGLARAYGELTCNVILPMTFLLKLNTINMGKHEERCLVYPRESGDVHRATKTYFLARKRFRLVLPCSADWPLSSANDGKKGRNVS